MQNEAMRWSAVRETNKARCGEAGENPWSSRGRGGHRQHPSTSEDPFAPTGVLQDSFIYYAFDLFFFFKLKLALVGSCFL